MSRQLHALQVFACAYNISQTPSQDNTNLSEVDVNFEVQSLGSAGKDLRKSHWAEDYFDVLGYRRRISF